MFQDKKEEQQCNSDSGTTEILFVVWSLLVSQPCDDEHDQSAENGLLMKTIVGNCSSSQMVSSGPFQLLETALGLLATVAAQGGATALAGRQHECIIIICDTIGKCAIPVVMLQGAHAICYILTSYNWYASVKANDSGEGQTTSRGSFVWQIVKVVMMMLTCQEEHAATGLSAPVCCLLAALFESNDEMRSYVVD